MKITGKDIFRFLIVCLSVVCFGILEQAPNSLPILDMETSQGMSSHGDIELTDSDCSDDDQINQPQFSCSEEDLTVLLPDVNSRFFSIKYFVSVWQPPETV